jgi:hypothetical protein
MVIAVALASLAFVAAGGTALAAPPVLQPFPVPTSQFTVGIPDGWAAFDLSQSSAKDIREELESLDASDPVQLSSTVGVLLREGVKLYAVDPKRHAKLNANMNVVRNPTLERTLDKFKRDLKAPYENLDVKVPKIQEVQVDGVDALEASGKIDVNDTKVLLRQVILIIGQEYLQFTISTRPNQAGRETSDAMVASIDLTDPSSVGDAGQQPAGQ